MQAWDPSFLHNPHCNLISRQIPPKPRRNKKRSGFVLDQEIRLISPHEERTRFSACFWMPVKLCWQQRFPILQLVRRSLAARFKGSVVGISWAIVQPLMMIALFTFLFGFLFAPRGIRVPADMDITSFAKHLFAGLVLHSFIVEVISGGPTLIISNTNYVKKVVFPLEILSVVHVFAALVVMSVGFLVLVVVHVLTAGTFPPTIVFAPIVVAPLVIMSLGISWALAAIGAFARDIEQIVGPLATMLLFLSPIFFKLDVLPPVLQTLVYFNPLTVPVLDLRVILFDGGMPNWPVLGTYYIISILIMAIGFYVFSRARRAFADVI